MKESKSPGAPGRRSEIAGRQVSTTKWIAVIIAIHVMLGSAYWLYRPYGAPPDEGPHGLYVRELAVERRLPVFSASDRDNYEAHQPPLYYALGVPFYLIAKTVGADEPASGVRLLSLILGGLCILVAYSAVSVLLSGRSGTALACAGFVAFLPMHVALSSSVANETLTELVFGLTLLLVGRMLVHGASWQNTRWLGLVLGAGLLTKTSCVLLFPIVVLAYSLLWQRGALSPKGALRHLGAVAGISLALGGWWLIRNTVLYGDPFALTKFEEAFAHTAKPDFWLSRGWPWVQYFMLVTGWTFASFWGVFGHMKVFMPSVIYYILAGVTLAAALRCIRPVAELRASSAGARDIILVYLVATVLVLLVFVRFNTSFFQAQGRYLYPALVPFTLFWVLGFERLLPRRNREWSAAVVNAGMFLLALAALFITIIPNMPHQW